MATNPEQPYSLHGDIGTLRTIARMAAYDAYQDAVAAAAYAGRSRDLADRYPQAMRMLCGAGAAHYALAYQRARNALTALLESAQAMAEHAAYCALADAGDEQRILTHHAHEWGQIHDAPAPRACKWCYIPEY